MPPNTEAFSLTYQYERRNESIIQVERGDFIARQEINILDLDIIAPNETQV